MLAVAGGKGGCGKTTTTLGLALAAARAGRPSLAVDADVDMPDLHRVAGVRREACGPGPIGAHPVASTARAAVAPAPPGTTPEDRRAELSTLPGNGRTVLVDCPAGAGRDTAAPMRAADSTLVVTTPEEASVRDAAKTAAMSRAVGTPVAGAVATGTDRGPDGIEGVLEAPILGALPREAAALGAPGSNQLFSRLLGRLPDV